MGYENVTDTKLTGEIKKVVTDKESYESKTLILANGGSGRMLGIPGESLKGVRLNAPKNGLDYEDIKSVEKASLTGAKFQVYCGYDSDAPPNWDLDHLAYWLGAGFA